MTSTSKARRIFDATAVPDGERQNKAWPQILSDQIEEIVQAQNALSDAQAEAVDQTSWPRITNCDCETGSPLVLTADQMGSVVDDVLTSGFGGPRAAATEFKLPNHTEFENLAERVPWVKFSNTSGYAMRIVAGDDDTIQVDESDATATGGHVDVLSSNGGLELELLDDRWRARSVTGEWSVDA